MSKVIATAGSLSSWNKPLFTFSSTRLSGHGHADHDFVNILNYLDQWLYSSILRSASSMMDCAPLFSMLGRVTFAGDGVLHCMVRSCEGKTDRCWYIPAGSDEPRLMKTSCVYLDPGVHGHWTPSMQVYMKQDGKLFRPLKYNNVRVFWRYWWWLSQLVALHVHCTVYGPHCCWSLRYGHRCWMDSRFPHWGMHLQYNSTTRARDYAGKRALIELWWSLPSHACPALYNWWMNYRVIQGNYGGTKDNQTVLCRLPAKVIICDKLYGRRVVNFVWSGCEVDWDNSHTYPYCTVLDWVDYIIRILLKGRLSGVNSTSTRVENDEQLTSKYDNRQACRFCSYEQLYTYYCLGDALTSLTSSSTGL